MGGILRLQVGIGGKGSNYAYSLRVEGILSLQVGVGSLSRLASRGNIPARKEVSLSDFWSLLLHPLILTTCHQPIKDLLGIL